MQANTHAVQFKGVAVDGKSQPRQNLRATEDLNGLVDLTRLRKYFDAVTTEYPNRSFGLGRRCSDAVPGFAGPRL